MCTQIIRFISIYDMKWYERKLKYYKTADFFWPVWLRGRRRKDGVFWGTLFECSGLQIEKLERTPCQKKSTMIDRATAIPGTMTKLVYWIFHIFGPKGIILLEKMFSDSQEWLNKHFFWHGFSISHVAASKISFPMTSTMHLSCISNIFVQRHSVNSRKAPALKSHIGNDI